MNGVGREPAFGLDSFGKPKLYTEAESIAKLFVNLLFLEEGQLPSMPHIGIGIQNWLYRYIDKLTDVEELSTNIQNQCNRLFPYIDASNITIMPIYEGTDRETLLIKLPLNIDTKDIYVGVVPKKGEDIKFMYTIKDNNV